MSFRFLVTDSTGAAATKACNLIVERAEFSLTSCPLPNGSIGIDYQQSLRVDGGTPPYIFSALSALPAGLSLTTNGLLAGRPREAGSGTVRLRVMDSRGQVTTQACGLPIAPSPLVITGTCPMPQARLGSAYLQRFTASGGVAPYRFRLDGALPAGLELSPDGTVRGIPLAAGETDFEIEAVDAQGWSIPKNCSIQSSLPELPTFRLSGLPSTAAPATTGPVAAMELSHAYSLPVQGEFVLTIEPDTGSVDPAINRADPRLFRQRRTAPSFYDSRRNSPDDRSYCFHWNRCRLGDGAGDESFSGRTANPHTANSRTVPNRARPFPQSGCLSGNVGDRHGGTDHWLLHYPQLGRAEFTYTAGTQQQTASVDVSGSAAEYFTSDLSVRNGGAFTLSVPLTIEGTGTLQPNTVTLSNAVGTTAAKTVAACR